MKAKFFGTRGSIAVPGSNTLVYGGNTSCVQISSGDNKTLIIDAGTGIRELGKEIVSDTKIKDINILISHTHWDHIQGLPFFLPLFHPEYDVDLFISARSGVDESHIIDAQMNPNYFPVDKDVFGAKLKFGRIESDKSYKFGSLEVKTIAVHHTQGTLAFRISENGKSVVYMTDNEIYADFKNGTPVFETLYEKNDNLIEFCRGCDYLIHDSMYLVKDIEKKKGWGHSDNHSLAFFSILAEVKNLVLFHYEPDYSDNIVQQMRIDTQEIINNSGKSINCIASKELMVLDI